MNSDDDSSLRLMWRKPSSFKDFVGQRRAVGALRSWLRLREPGALLLYGPQGIGKTSLAKLMGKAVYCKYRLPDESPCGQCAACASFELEKYPLGFVYFDASIDVSDDGLRNFAGSIGGPGIDQSHFVIVDNVDRLKPKKIDIFLKTVEEHREATFVFIARELRSVRPAIVSRCRSRFQMKELPRADMARLTRRSVSFVGLKPDEGAIDLALDFSRGTPSRLYEALDLLQQEAAWTVPAAAAVLLTCTPETPPILS